MLGSNRFAFSSSLVERVIRFELERHDCLQLVVGASYSLDSRPLIESRRRTPATASWGSFNVTDVNRLA